MRLPRLFSAALTALAAAVAPVVPALPPVIAAVAIAPAQVSLAQAGEVPAWANLYTAAQRIKYGDCRMLLCGDSNSTTQVYGGRLGGVSYFYTWKPVTWRGLFAWSTANGANDLAAGTGGVNAGTSLLCSPRAWHLAGGVTKVANCYAYFNATFAHYGGSYNSVYFPAAGSPYGTPVYTATTTFFPGGWVDQGFDGAALPAASTVYWYFDVSAAGLTYMYGGDPFASKTVTGRWVGYKNTNGPNLTLYTYKATATPATGGGATLTTNGAAAWTSAEATWGGGANSLMRLQLATQNPIGITGSSRFLSVGCRIWKASDTTGLEIGTWGEGGWAIQHFFDTSIASDQGLADCLSYMMGTAGTPGPTNGPNVYWLEVGQNNIATWDRTIFMGYYRSALNRLRTVSALNGVNDPLFVLVAPWQPSTTYTAANYDAMAQAIYDISQEYGAGFINLRKCQPPVDAMIVGRSNTNADERMTYDLTHGLYSGNIARAAMEWSVLEAALSAGPPAPRFRKAG